MILTTTFQMDLNLYLYLPPLSAHPPSCLKGLINGELCRYWTKNTNHKDFQDILTKFIAKLLDREHTITTLTPMLLEAAARLDHVSVNDTNDASSKLSTFIGNTTPTGYSSKKFVKYIMICYNMLYIMNTCRWPFHGLKSLKTSSHALLLSYLIALTSMISYNNTKEASINFETATVNDATQVAKSKISTHSNSLALCM
jgi:hypothetical protein